MTKTETPPVRGPAAFLFASTIAFPANPFLSASPALALKADFPLATALRTSGTFVADTIARLSAGSLTGCCACLRENSGDPPAECTTNGTDKAHGTALSVTLYGQPIEDGSQQ